MPIAIWFIFEILIFIAFISWLGFGYAILIYIIPMLIGALLLRKAGLANPEHAVKLQAQMTQGGNPMASMMKMMSLTFGGFLLLIPGLFTTLIGLLVLLPLTRLNVTNWLMSRQWFQSKFYSKMHGNPFQGFADMQSPNTKTSNDKVHKGRTVDADE